MAASTTRRSIQVASTRIERVQVVRWMIEQAEAGVSNFKSAAVAQFPPVFRSNYKSNIQKAYDS